MGTTRPTGARRNQGPEIDIHGTIPESLRDVLPGRGTDFFPVEVVGNDGNERPPPARHDLRHPAVSLLRHGGKAVLCILQRQSHVEPPSIKLACLACLHPAAKSRQCQAPESQRPPSFPSPAPYESCPCPPPPLQPPLPQLPEVRLPAAPLPNLSRPQGVPHLVTRLPSLVPRATGAPPISPCHPPPHLLDVPLQRAPPRPTTKPSNLQ